MKEISAQDREFIDFCIKRLEISTAPNITIGDDHAKAQRLRAMGYYSPVENLIWVLRGSRVSADWYRTLAHELVHWRQRELGQLQDGSDGSGTENEANSKAAVLLREWGRDRPAIYIATNFKNSIDIKDESSKV
jgi:antirestriction protein ArdC